jgi:outer membrane protein assembly factor BamD
MKITLYNITKVIGIIILLASCSSKNTKDLSQGQIDLGRAKEFQQAGRFELATEHYMEIKNKYPLSPEATVAELELAETYYLQGAHAEARAAFEAFRDLHPRHKEVHFASFRIAMSHYKALPKTIDRDLASAKQAIEAFATFLKDFPKSSFAEEAKTKKRECETKLGNKELYIADFYFKTKEYKPAASRYRYILKHYRDLGMEEKSLFHLGLCYVKLDEKKNAKKTLSVFVKRYKDSKHTKQAQKLLSEL